MSPEELEKLETLQLKGRYTKYQKTLDAFLFCCYAGMRYSDFVNMKPDNIVEMHQETWLIYKSIKTGTEVRLPLYLLFSGKGILILNKYQANLQDFFHLRDNSNVNKELIIIARLAGVAKKVSFHTASHSKFFYLLNISELSILKNVTANDLETSYILFLSQLCNIQRTL